MYRFKRLVCLGALAMLAVSGASAAGNASCSWSTQPDTLEQVKPHRKARKNPSLPAQGGQGRVPLIVDTTLFEPSDDASSSRREGDLRSEVAGNYPHEQMYLLQHLFNNWFLDLELGRITAAAVIVVGTMLAGAGALWALRRRLQRNEKQC